MSIHLLFGVLYIFSIIMVKALNIFILNKGLSEDTKNIVSMATYYAFLFIYLILDLILFKDKINLAIIIVWLLLSPLFYGIVVKGGVNVGEKNESGIGKQNVRFGSIKIIAISIWLSYFIVVVALEYYMNFHYYKTGILSLIGFIVMIFGIIITHVIGDHYFKCE